MDDIRGESWRHELLVSLPSRSRTPGQAIRRRLLLAAGLLLVTTVVVFLDRFGYRDHATGAAPTLVDCIYFAMGSITATSVSDIVAVNPRSRLISAFVLAPVRLLFLVVMVVATVDILSPHGRRAISDMRWRKKMRAHSIVIGYGTKGRSAVKTLQVSGVSAEKIVVIDTRPKAIADANRLGLAAIEGDANRRETLMRAEIIKAREIIITLDRDDATILATLTVRQLNPSAHIVSCIQDEDNVRLVRQSGANIVVTSSDAVGRLMGLSSLNPNLGKVLEDLLATGQGIEIAQRQATSQEVGQSPASIMDERVLAVVRKDVIRRFFDASVQHLEVGDELIVVRRSVGDRKAEREAKFGS